MSAKPHLHYAVDAHVDLLALVVMMVVVNVFVGMVMTLSENGESEQSRSASQELKNREAAGRVRMQQ